MKKNILFPDKDNVRAQLGGKASALNTLTGHNIPVPPWFVISPAAFYCSLPENIREQFNTLTNISVIRQTLSQLQPPQILITEIQIAIAKLCPVRELLAVRSSACDEDGIEYSFAGQLESFLYVEPEQVINNVVNVWRSGFSERIFEYRKNNNLSLIPSVPAVLIQKMLQPDMAGVAFGADPVHGNRSVHIISSVYGNGHALVAGDTNADTFRIDNRDTLLDTNIQSKALALIYNGNTHQLESIQVDENKQQVSSLNSEQLIAINQILKQVNQLFHCPQDIEWAIENHRLYLLQSRPITSINKLADPDGKLKIWDNSNIAESYNGVTTPLTFSFAQRAYEEVYRQFCVLMGVQHELITENGNVFRNMLGLIQGRIYYNLINWYCLLALLPGFKMNRKFMEQMMGVKEQLPDSALNISKTISRLDQLKDGMRFGITISKLIINQWRLPNNIKIFYQRLDDALGKSADGLSTMRIDELATEYRRLETALLSRWDAPLVNDFFAMIYYGLLRSLSQKWLDDKDGTLQNELLTSQGGIISAEPAKRIIELAEFARPHPELIELMMQIDAVRLDHHFKKWPEFNSRLQQYIERFGDRCIDELKLESETLIDNPTLLLQSIAQLALNSQVKDSGKTKSEQISTEQLLNQHLASHRIKRLFFNWVLNHARTRVRERENLRFERTRIFGRVRRIFKEIGSRLYANRLIDDSQDIFYLEVGEILGFIEGTATTLSLNTLIEIRKNEFKRFRTMLAPADRIETHGAVHIGNNFQSTPKFQMDNSSETHKGIGCCPGIVKGTVRVVKDPRRESIQPGEILVAERTDPGWIILFASAGGLLVERGSLLSHAAIVAREMGIPAIVSIEGVTSWLKTGDTIEFDGRTGVIRKLGSTNVH